ncbi:hypothetical protein RCG23_03760 [Neobacillus sp. PS3-34]|uniref:hypothetical protein n=1 Tax=Neobacillus sp. PS3-34 TaxID=3070678 RepID=UPI0027DF015B|nr:hypothetical protein [Neobacillus sp. PS3-34]WML50511.1 hypothetical protein RCG23_03760 [Neobacillus sp. PS3-34]
MGLLTTILPVIMIIFVIVAIVKSKGKGDDETVIRHVYTYLVLFATLMMVIGGGISIFMAAADLISPPAYFQNYDDFRQTRLTENPNTKSQMKEEKIRADYNQTVKDEKARNQADAKNQIIKSLGFIVIPLPIFLYFNRLRKKQSDI